MKNPLSSFRLVRKGSPSCTVKGGCFNAAGRFRLSTHHRPSMRGVCSKRFIGFRVFWSQP